MPDFYKKNKIFCEFFYMSPFVVFLCTDKSVSIQLCPSVNGVADESEIEKQMQDIADGVLKEASAEDAKK